MESSLPELSDCVIPCLDWISEKSVKPTFGQTWRFFAWTLFCGAVLSFVPLLLSQIGFPLLSSAFCYFWFALLAKKHISNYNTYLLIFILIWSTLLLELGLYTVGFRGWLTYSASCAALLTPLSAIYHVRPLTVCKVIAFSSLVRTLSISSTSWLATSTWQPIFTAIGSMFGVFIARYVETIAKPAITALLTSTSSKRRSSKSRRTSLPSQLSIGSINYTTTTTSRALSIHGNANVSPSFFNKRWQCKLLVSRHLYAFIPC